MEKKLITSVLAASLFIFGASTVYASTLQGFQGGTGISNATSGQLNYVPTVASTSPFLTYSLQPVAASSGGVSTSTSNTWAGTQSFATTTANVFNNVVYVPVNLTSGVTCGTSTGVTDLGTCVNDIYASFASSTYNKIVIPPMNVLQANWTTGINFNRSGVFVNFMGQGQPTIHYGGTGTAITVNDGDSVGHLITEIGGFQLNGSSSLIAAGQTNNATTTGILCGGTNGCVGLNFHDMSINGFGSLFKTGANTYMLTVQKVAFSGNNGTLGNMVYIAPASNSGEGFSFLDNTYTDPGNSTTTSPCFYADNGALADLTISGKAVDDCQIYIGTSNGKVSIENVHFENSDYSQYGSYIPVYATSSQATQLDFNNNEIANDTSGANSFSTIIKHGVNLWASGNHIDNYGGGTITYFADHSLNNGSESELVCQTQVQGGTLTNIVRNQAYAQNVGSGCIQTVANSYPFVMYIDSGNTEHLRNGNGDVMTVTSNGAFTFSNNGTSGGPFSFYGNLNATGTITQSGVPVLTSIPVKYASSTLTFGFPNATTTKPYSFEWTGSQVAHTLSAVDCGEYAAATTTLTLGYATTLAHAIAGTIDQTLLSSIVCGINGNSTTSFTTSTIPANDWVLAVVSSTTGTPTLTTINLYTTK